MISKSSSFVITMICFLLFSCTENQNTTETDSNGSKKIHQSGWENPAEETGIFHNGALEYYLDNKAHDEICEFIEYNGDYYMTKEQFDCYFNIVEDYYDSLGITENIFNSMYNILYNILDEANLIITDGDTILIDRISGNLTEFVNASFNLGYIDSFNYNKVLPIAEAADNEDYELTDSLINNLPYQTYNFDEHQPLLSGYSVHYYSSNYWDSYDEGLQIYQKKSDLQMTDEDLENTCSAVDKVVTYGINIAVGLAGVGQLLL